MNLLHDLLRESAERYPDGIAVIDPEPDFRLSYRDLDASSERLKDILVGCGVRPGDRVGICAPKSTGTVAAIFAILKSGAGYVPVDYSAPATRNAYIFRDCNVSAIIVKRSHVAALRTALGEDSFSEFELAETPFPEYTDLAILRDTSRVESTPRIDGLAYILYTSGSTGLPKGVIHTHASALAFINWCSTAFEPTVLDRFSSHAPFHFDLSILDIYVPIKHGSTIVLIGEDAGKQPRVLAPLISEQKITMWYSTPSILRMLLEYGQLEDYDYSSLRIVNFAGEVFPIKHFRALVAAWPGQRYFNLFGPTETNVCTYYEVKGDNPSDYETGIPIGWPCSDNECRVLELDSVEPRDGLEQQTGELIVSGGSVMQGYWNLPERTAEIFIELENGRKWYRTGDIVTVGEAGEFLFVGRRDRMVKRRGYRVELGEIEAAFYRNPELEEAAVVAVPDEENGVQIRAYVRFADGVKPSTIKMKRYASEHLPLYMIPDRFIFPPELPKTSTDKIDYQKLAEID